MKNIILQIKYIIFTEKNFYKTLKILIIKYIKSKIKVAISSFIK